MSSLNDLIVKRERVLETPSIVVFSSAARTTTTNSSDILKITGKGVKLYLDISAASGTSPTLDISVQAKDALTGMYFGIPDATFAQKSGTGGDTLTIYPGIAETANSSISDILSKTWRVVATIGGGTPSFTFTIGAEYI